MAGINCDIGSLTDWTCTMEVYETYGWAVEPHNRDLKSFTTDLVSWTTMFIWTVVLFALVYSWILMVIWWADEKKLETGKKWVYYSIIWLLLVGFSYWIIRLIQLLAHG